MSAQSSRCLPLPKGTGKGQFGHKTPNSSSTPSERIAAQLVKTCYCKHYFRGYCLYEDKCAYAHSADELMPRPNLSKTKMCPDFAAGSCTNPKCTFAHGTSEMRRARARQPFTAARVPSSSSPDNRGMLENDDSLSTDGIEDTHGNEMGSEGSTAFMLALLQRHEMQVQQKQSRIQEETSWQVRKAAEQVARQLMSHVAQQEQALHGERRVRGQADNFSQDALQTVLKALFGLLKEEENLDMGNLVQEPAHQVLDCQARGEKEIQTPPSEQLRELDSLSGEPTGPTVPNFHGTHFLPVDSANMCPVVPSFDGTQLVDSANMVLNAKDMYSETHVAREMCDLMFGRIERVSL